jgi:hypothetical protein
MRSSHVLILGVFGVLAVSPSAALAQKCTWSQDAAVACFVRDAVSTRLAVVPPGMSATDYRAYGVAVSKILQDSKTMAVMFGLTSAIGDALPPTNANGTPNQSAQIAAVNAILDAALKDRILTLPSGATADQLKQMARDMTEALAQNTGISISPGLVLRTLDSYLVNATTSMGTVDLLQVTTGISNLVDNLLASGLMRLPANVSDGNIAQFALDVTMSINQYKKATGKARL